MFCKYVLNEKQLQDNSFPDWLKTNNENNKKRLAYIPNFSNSTDQLNKQLIKKVDSSILVKICKRCNKTFQLNSIDMTYSSNNSDCVFHWGKIRNQRFNKLVEQKYSCCSNEANSEGCEVGKHVYDGDYDGNGIGTNISDYVETQEDPTPSSKQSSNVYALDCEMCYTTRGLELARVSIVDINLKEVYDSIVKPDGQILDYNTRWSGLIEDSFKNCTKKLKNVQNDLLKMFNKNTILIGHSLDSDFKALKLIHKKVIDTSVVFPHKLGPPLKRALKNLMSEYLQRIIQEDTDGHDSKEDASACIQLMIWKINEDLKNRSNIKKYSQQNFKSNQTSASLSIAQSSSSSSVIHHYHKKNIQHQESINKNNNNNSKYRQNNFINNQTNNTNTNNNSKSATNKYKLISPNY
jgi:RNA exonuclease 1